MLPPKSRRPDCKLPDDRLGELSEAIRQRVKATRKIQHARLEERELTCSADMGGAEARDLFGWTITGAASYGLQ